MSALSPGDSHRMLIRAPRRYVPNSADFVVGRARMIKPVLAVTTPETAAPNASLFASVETAPSTCAVSTDAGTAATAPCSSHARPRLTAPRTSDENIILRTDNHHTFRSSPAKGDMERTPHMPSATTP
ncbi:hypothetical protein [Streptomyces sp. NPDC003393]